MAAISEVTDNSFQAEVLEADTPVLVDFWAPWCGPCRMVAPVLEEIAGERGEALKIVKLNVDDNQQTAAQFEVLSIPTLILFKQGQVAAKVIGAMPKKRLEAELEPAPAARRAPDPRGAGARGGHCRGSRAGRASRLSDSAPRARRRIPRRGPRAPDA